MKRINNRGRYLRNQARAKKRSVYERKRRTRHRDRHPGRVHYIPSALVAPERTRVVAPAHFSLIENPEGVIDFLNELDSASKLNKPIFIDSKNVTSMTLDALLVLLAKMKSGQFNKCRSIGGNEPKDEKVRDLFIHSGFYSHMARKPHSYRESDAYGLLKKHEGKKVRENTCAELVHYATNKLYGGVRKNGGLYRTLIECMANTRDHASGNRSNSESWWVSAYYDEERQIVHFAFVDSGVGIFRSVRMVGVLQVIGKFLGILKYPDLLKDLLNAELGSRTGLPYRGKGFPAIKRAEQRGQFRNLKIVTNTAHLDSTTGRGTVLPREFRGTCITWELHRE